METVLVAKALVIDDEHNCLILRRSKTHPNSALMPDLPGGQLDEGESPQDAVVREILEETALRVDLAKTHLLYATTECSRGRNVVRFLFVARVHGVKPEVTISWEHSEAWWVPLEAVATELEHREYLKGIRYIQDNGILKDILE